MKIFINTYGTSVKIQDGLLSVKHEEAIKRVPLGKVKTIYLTKGIFLSTDVIFQCLDLGIDMLITERNGHPVGRLWNNKFGSISSIRKSQLDFSRGEGVLPWVVDQISKKIENQIDLLYCLMTLDEPHETLIEQSARHMSEMRQKIMELSGSGSANGIKEGVVMMDEAGPKIRAYEGQASRQYFQCVSKHMPFRFQFSGRSRHPAGDMVNALLNYAYGILYGHIESALIKSGLDPYIGFFHRDEYNRPVLTYDVIEPFRPWADWAVFHLCLNEILDESQFEKENGSFWLLSDAKRLLIQHFTDFFEEVVDYKGKRFSRMIHLDRAAQSLANKIL